MPSSKFVVLSFLGTVALGIALLIAGLRTKSSRATMAGVCIFATLVILLLLALNWAAFVSPPEACWRGRRIKSIDVPQCRAIFVATAIAFDALLIGGVLKR